MPSLTGTTVIDELLLEATLASNKKYLPRSSISATSHVLDIDIKTYSINELTVFANNNNGLLGKFTVVISRQTADPIITQSVKVSNFTTFTVTGSGNAITVNLSDTAYVSYFFMTMK